MDTEIDTSDLDYLDGEEEVNATATTEPTAMPMEFHVQLAPFLIGDVEDRIVKAAATLIVGRHYPRTVLENAVIETATGIIGEKLSTVVGPAVNEALDAPVLTGKDGPIRLSEVIAMQARSYLMAMVTSEDKPSSSAGWDKVEPRINWIVKRHLDAKFQREIKAATDEAIRAIQAEVKKAAADLVAEEKARIRAAIEKETK